VRENSTLLKNKNTLPFSSSNITYKIRKIRNQKKRFVVLPLRWGSQIWWVKIESLQLLESPCDICTLYFVKAQIPVFRILISMWVFLLNIIPKERGDEWEWIQYNSDKPKVVRENEWMINMWGIRDSDKAVVSLIDMRVLRGNLRIIFAELISISIRNWLLTTNIRGSHSLFKLLNASTQNWDESLNIREITNVQTKKANQTIVSRNKR
jgi:hypothetical protein